MAATPLPLTVLNTKAIGMWDCRSLLPAPLPAIGALGTSRVPLLKFGDSNPRWREPPEWGPYRKRLQKCAPRVWYCYWKPTIKMGFIIPFFASPGIAAIASRASPSIAPPSESRQTVVRIFLSKRSATANPCAWGRPEPSGPLAIKTPGDLSAALRDRLIDSL